MLLLTADRNVLQDTIEDFLTSIAVVEPSPTGAFNLLAANAPFFAMLHMERTAPAYDTTLYDYIPTYAIDAFLKALDECLGTMKTTDFLQTYDHMGRSYWWRIQLKPITAEFEGKLLIRIMISGLDITDKYELAGQLRTEQQRYRALFDSSYDGMLTVTREHCIKAINHTALKMFGYQKNELANAPLAQLIPDRYRETHPKYIEQFERSPIMSRHMLERSEVHCLRKDGSEFPAEISISKINVAGEVEFTAIVRDISARLRTMDELKLRADTDPLTSLHNRRHAVELGETLWAVHQRQGASLAVAMFDLDTFKGINDSYGHAAGDAVLVEVARRLKAEQRRGDVLARVGGEEFLCLFANTNLEQAQEIAERLRQCIASKPMLLDATMNLRVQVTCSIGLSTSVADDTKLDDAIVRADKQLYRAKHEGKNRVCA